jgi:hypothetical protein
VAFTAELARALEQGVVRAPEPHEPAHGHVVGRKTKRVSRTFARRASWVVTPEE